MYGSLWMPDNLYSNYVILYGNYVVDNRWNIVSFLTPTALRGLLIHQKFTSLSSHPYNFISISENNFRFGDTLQIQSFIL